VTGDTSMSPSELPPLKPGSQLGPYRIEASLGSGGMGHVFRALDTRLHRQVALKVLHGDNWGDSLQRRRLLQEARAASALNHSNIVVVYDIVSNQQLDFLVMEYIAGRTLKELLAEKAIPLERVSEIAAQIASALSTAHAAGITHCDIKPANVIVTDDGRVKVLDFGIAKHTLPENTQLTRLTAPGSVVGTVDYMSPEQTRGEVLDGRSDIFSLGSLLYHVSTGQLPFQGKDCLVVMNSIANSYPPPPSSIRPDLSPAFDACVSRCLAKLPEQRPSAADLVKELQRIASPSQPSQTLQTREPSVAVVPFLFRNAAAEDQFLSVALADALIHRLNSTGKLIVRPTAAVMRYAGKETDWTQVARELNTDLVVEGTIQKMGKKIRVMLQVFRASDQRAIHSLRQDGEMDDLFALQDRVSDSVSEVFVPREKQSTAPAAAPTRNQAAYELYLRGLERASRWVRRDVESAVELLTRVTEMDPAFADAWGSLAQVYYTIFALYDPDPKLIELTEQAIARTLELDPVHPTALCAHSQLLWSAAKGFQNRPALRAVTAALKVDSRCEPALHWRGCILFHLGYYSQAVQDMEEVLRIHPRSALARASLAHIALDTGKLDVAVDEYERVIEMEPHLLSANVFSPMAHIVQGRLEEGRRLIQRARTIFPAEPQLTAMEAIAAALDGDFKRAENLADESLREQSRRMHTHHAWHCAANAYAVCGKDEKALTQLRRCAGFGLPNYQLFSRDPLLRSLAGNNEYETFLTELRREQDTYSEEFGLNPLSR
jgi:serine/threonine protein kinase/tetratricopeptide (TPR) repeat protein